MVALGSFESSVVLFGESRKWLQRGSTHTGQICALVLGSSLKVGPARAMPGQVVKQGCRLVIVNLQCTHFDVQAVPVISVRCDVVMRLIVEERHLELQPSPSEEESLSPLHEGSASQNKRDDRFEMALTTR